MSDINWSGTSSQFVKGDGSLDGTTYAVDADVLHTNATAETKLGKLTIDNDFEVRKNLQINRLSIYNDRSQASNFSNGVLVETNITSSSTSFALELLMNGNSSSVEKVLISGYRAGILTGIPHTFDAVTLDPNITEAVYAVKDGKLCFWITGLPNSSLNVAGKLLTGYSTSFNQITSISDSVKPTTP